MALRIFLICGACAFLALPAGAGPWSRDTGTSFLSLSNERDSAGNNYTGIYGEFGYGERRTFGYEIGHTNVGETTAMIWLQRQLDHGEGAWRLSYALGGGVLARDGELVPLGQAGIAAGRGFDGILGGGWFAAELKLKVAGETTTVVWRQGLSEIEESYLTPDVTTKAEVTLGLRPWDRMMLVNQLRLEQRKDLDLSAKLAVSLVRDLTKGVKLELGAIQPIAGPGDPAVKVGTWIAF
jgi:hypothetical protein